MKKLLKCIPVLLAAAAFLLFIPSNTVSVEAAGQTYYIMYRQDAQEWRYVKDSEWLDGYGIGRELYYLTLEIEDGDSIIVSGYDPESDPLELKLSASLASLTLRSTGNTLITVNSVENCYITSGTILSLTGNVTNVYIKDSSSATFYGNISYLEVGQSEDEVAPNVSNTGTVGHLAIFNIDGQQTCSVYNVDAGALTITNGKLGTSAAHYSTTASASGTAASTGAATAAAASGSTSSTTAAGSTYTVVKGDNLWKIAQRYLGNGMRYPEIKALSGISSDTIYAGQVLTLPAD
ncbi:MAG: LysM peptidoglycan-binding domain-containing protein [Lachnospiraceae bacterium]|nr:LysM peptidoglycan-binding domain-containing protein [Lachnospiraceae bacterium]